MNNISIWHWVIVALWAIGIGIPTSAILKRMGFSRWWTLIALIPWVNILALWVVAYMWADDDDPLRRR